MNVILNVGGRLDIPSVIGKLKLLLSVGIKLRCIGDDVVQRFMHGRKKTVDTGFPVVAALVSGQVGARVAFSIASRLRNDYRSGQWIGSQIGAGVACTHTLGKTGGGEIWRRGNSVLKKTWPLVFRIACDVLPLAGLLLDEFVGDEKTDGVIV